MRSYIVSKRALELDNRGIETGVLKSDAQAVIDKLEPKYSGVLSELQKYQESTLNYLKDSGLLSEQSVEKMRKLNRDYVPFYRVMDTWKTGGAGVGLEARQPVKSITGSWRDIQDPLESIIKNTYLFFTSLKMFHISFNY